MDAGQVEYVGIMMRFWPLNKYGRYANDMRWKGAQSMSIVTIKAIYP